jgi:hypothetical protein
MMRGPSLRSIPVIIQIGAPRLGARPGEFLDDTLDSCPTQSRGAAEK